MRTLVIGIPLPHVSFDNYSFISAPSLPDYRRLIVETASVSMAVEEVREGSGQHLTFVGQPVVDGPTTAESFGLAQLLAMRRREAERFLERGGVVACLVHPDVAQAGPAGGPGWWRYAWLPAPEGFRYQEHLLPGFGRAGVSLEDEAHPFAPYVRSYGPRLAYRASADEGAPGFGEYARVFARSAGGEAVGVELAVGAGRVVLLPPLPGFDKERQELATVLLECFERCQEGGEQGAPQWMRKEVS